MNKKLGIDLDGCLFDFSTAYAAELTKVTGINFPKISDEWPLIWFWERELGVKAEDEKKVWQDVIMKEGSTFWQTLQPLEEAKGVFSTLNHLTKTGHEVYFITNRMGSHAKLQTEKSLYEWGVDYPTVILSGDKTPLIKCLDLTFFIDDKWETVRDLLKVSEAEGWGKGRHFFLKDAPYNRSKRDEWKEVRVVASVMEGLKEVGLG